MRPEQLRYSDTDPWTWTRAAATDVEDIVRMAQDHYQLEIESVLTPSPETLTYNLHKTVVEQIFQPHQVMLSVARDKIDNHLMAWAWLERGSYTPYSPEEMATAEFLHTDLTASARTKTRLVGQALESWILWCELNKIPVLVSTSIRDSYAGFMRIHDAYGFQTKGSYAYRKI